MRHLGARRIAPTAPRYVPRKRIVFARFGLPLNVIGQLVAFAHAVGERANDIAAASLVIVVALFGWIVEDGFAFDRNGSFGLVVLLIRTLGPFHVAVVDGGGSVVGGRGRMVIFAISFVSIASIVANRRLMLISAVSPHRHGRSSAHGC